ncbi:TonB-linked outer membrane protein, SusC/RagA family [Formosa sp. Hel1_31_208]|uniref:SusC/RagA family TonB-linked outer membrane protein n=1 Tax=Formosa sp. Hel1_31_208 TaxID=1798225 RepID=UPI00087D8C1D|nr:TonB-dependent receptor [Formosa sp. Hel1_31_208]SDS23503.1 TonB-linked outer membrane protein, SusC/RagA family [Formosa sp. Hel1_31_208]
MYSKLFTILVVIFSASLYAQNINVTGTITETSTGIPLPGVNVLVKNTSKGASTDFDGKFVLNDVSINSVLVISYLGYKTKEITVTNAEPLFITLDEDSESLDEVVVIGYGTQRKKEITGAVSVVSSETIENLKPTRIEQALQGQVAGVNIVSNSGSPGASATISIRGVSTNGDSRPLILVDGTVVEDLSVINPNDIETVNVLKDATAGIYGVRAANGVILITTKSGRKSMPLTVELNTYGGFQETTRTLPVLNATEYALLLNEAYAANGENIPFSNVAGLGQGTNWQDRVFQKAPIVSTAITLKGGGEKSTYAYGGSFLTQDGIVGGDKSNFSRLTQRLSYSLDFLKNFKINTGVTWTHTSRRVLPENGIGSVLFNAINIAPTINTNQAANDLGFEIVNPIKQINNTFNRGLVDKINGNINLSYNFLEHFTAQASYQFNYAEVDSKVFSPEIDYGIQGTVDKVFDIQRNQVVETKSFFRDYTFDAFIKYENKFNDIHNLNVLLGTSVFKTTGNNTGNVGFGIVDNFVGNANIESATNIQNIFPFDSGFDSRLLSYFARVQYDYNGKYLVSAVIRRDGSSNFGPKNKFGYFPSASVGWIASEENFMATNSFIDFLKIRASYGVLGNDRIGAFRFVSVLDGEGVYPFNDLLNFGTTPGAISNPEIKWEKQKTLDIGLDMRFWENRMDLTLDYYKKRTEDLLVSPPVSGILGASGPGSLSPFINAGVIENKGFEFSLGYTEQLSENFKMNIKYNVSTIDNNVISVSSSGDFIPGGQFGVGQAQPSRMEAGQPIGYFRGFRTAGIFQNQAQIDTSPILNGNTQPGDLIFVDINGDGVINDDDRTNIGDPIPTATMGLNLSFDYKNFDFGAYAFASVGNDIVRNFERNIPNANRSVYFLDRWTGEGTSNSFPRVTTGATNNTLFSDFYVEDGSFIRLQNVQLGYSFSSDLLDKWGLKKLRLYVSASNLVTLTKYSGYDPTASTGEPIGGGIDYGFYPSPRTYLLGMNLKF